MSIPVGKIIKSHKQTVIWALDPVLAGALSQSQSTTVVWDQGWKPDAVFLREFRYLATAGGDNVPARVTCSLTGNEDLPTVITIDPHTHYNLYLQYPVSPVAGVHTLTITPPDSFIGVGPTGFAAMLFEFVQLEQS